MQVRLTVVDPRRRPGAVDLVVTAPSGATAADLIPSLAHELGWHPHDQQHLYVDGRVLPPTTPVGAPPLLEGAVITVTPTDPVRPPGVRGRARACSSCTSWVVPTPEPCCACPPAVTASAVLPRPVSASRTPACPASRLSSR